MTEHEIVIRLGRAFGVQTDHGAFCDNVREITIPFADRESAFSAHREITVTVRPVHDAGGEDYRTVVAGEVVKPVAEIAPASTRNGPSVLDCLEAAMRADPELTIEEAIRTVPISQETIDRYTTGREDDAHDRP